MSDLNKLHLFWAVLYLLLLLPIVETRNRLNSINVREPPAVLFTRIEQLISQRRLWKAIPTLNIADQHMATIFDSYIFVVPPPIYGLIITNSPNSLIQNVSVTAVAPLSDERVIETNGNVRYK